MIGHGDLALYLAAALLLAVTPGPGMLYVAGRTLAGGFVEGLASSLGTALGGMAHVAAAAVGVSALVLASANLFAALKIVGAGYLIWLGLRTARAARRDAAAIAAGLVGAPPAGFARAFREGVLVEALNPKTAAFFLALIPQFVDLRAGAVPAQFAVLGLISIALNTTADIVAAALASRLRAGVAGRPNVVRRLREASGALMIALGLGMMLTRRPAVSLAIGTP